MVLSSLYTKSTDMGLKDRKWSSPLALLLPKNLFEEFLLLISDPLSWVGLEFLRKEFPNGKKFMDLANYKQKISTSYFDFPVKLNQWEEKEDHSSGWYDLSL